MSTQITRLSNRDFIPQNVLKFYDFTLNISEYLTLARQKEWNIPGDFMSEYHDELDRLRIYLEQYDKTPTRANLERRNTAQRELTTRVRYLIRYYLRRQEVTDADLIAMRIPPIDHTRTPHVEVKETVDFVIHIRGTNNIIIDFWQTGVTTSKAKPRGYDGAVIVWAISETEPESDDLYNYHTLASRRPYTIEFDNKLSGKRVWVRAMWQNARGIKGRLSEAQTAIIP